MTLYCSDPSRESDPTGPFATEALALADARAGLETEAIRRREFPKETVIDPADISEELPCLLCGGPLYLMGCLGLREWFRCRNCGMDYGREIPCSPTQETAS